jgi:hypothetical protein
MSYTYIDNLLTNAPERNRKKKRKEKRTHVQPMAALSPSGATLRAQDII